MISALDLLPTNFLKQHWQQQPCLVREQFSKLLNQINLDKTILFKWSGDERLDSRLIQGKYRDNQWTVDFGPFDPNDFKDLGLNYWTLLVQDLDKVDSGCCNLLKAFDFIPRWRLDDVMASIATAGGSVGPHVDQYDVFLIQLSGQRHWQWSNNFESTLLEDQPLAVLKNFKPQHEATLKAGDMLYLPPGVAHHGVATGNDDCITLSVGCRAPSLADMLHQLAESIEQTNDSPRYRDPINFTNESELNNQQIEQLRQLLTHTFHQDERQLLSSFAQLLSEYRLNDALLDYSGADIEPSANQYFIQQPAARMVWHSINNTQAVLFCNGNRLECSAAAAHLITGRAAWQASQLQNAMYSYDDPEAAFKLIKTLFISGGIEMVV